jgi:DNA-directed RNA polymerase specialized sigma24 family protein
MEVIQVDVRGSEFIEEYPTDIVHDVQAAIGTLSAYHQHIVYAHYYEGKVIREIARDIGETFYRVFTELEIAKACLRTELAAYRK